MNRANAPSVSISETEVVVSTVSEPRRSQLTEVYTLFVSVGIHVNFGSVKLNVREGSTYKTTQYHNPEDHNQQAYVFFAV